MLKRTIATFLWLFAGWYGGAMLAEAFGVNTILGPALGLAAAVIVATDPRHVIWARPVDKAPETASRNIPELA